MDDVLDFAFLHPGKYWKADQSAPDGGGYGEMLGLPPKGCIIRMQVKRTPVERTLHASLP